MRCGIYTRVSTDEQRDNGYSIDSQLRMIKDYCEKNNYDIVDIYNDAGYSGKDLMRPEMQRLLQDIKSRKLDKLIAIKVDRLTRNNYDGFWLLNYCEEHDVKIELILEPYDVSTANVETINNKNDSIKKEIQKLEKKKKIINPDNNNKEYTLELLKKLNYSYDENTEEYTFLSNSFAFRNAKKEIIHRCIASLEIERDKNYNITIKNIKFTEEFISKNPKEYLDYLQNILSKNQVFITYKEAINKEKLDSLKDKYFIFYLSKILGNNHDNPEYKILLTILSEKIFNDEIIECPYIENGKIIDRLLLVHK